MISVKNFLWDGIPAKLARNVFSEFFQKNWTGQKFFRTVDAISCPTCTIGITHQARIFVQILSIFCQIPAKFALTYQARKLGVPHCSRQSVNGIIFFGLKICWNGPLTFGHLSNKLSFNMIKILISKYF